MRLESGGCCGRANISKGLLDDARGKAEDLLARLDGGDAPITGVEPSCLLTLREEHVQLLGAKAKGVADRTKLVEELLVEAIDDGALKLRDLGPRRILFHGHCHQKALAGTAATVALLQRIPGVEVEELDAGCCGMAGSFGFEAEHYELSMRIGGMRLFPAVRREPEGDPDRRHRRLLPSADRARNRSLRAPPGATRQGRTRLLIEAHGPNPNHRAAGKGLRACALRCCPMRLAVQLYTLRDRLEADLEGTLEALAGAGAEEVELAGLYDRDATELRTILDALGLSACSAHIALERFEDDFDAVLEEASALSFDTLIVPWVQPPENDDEADALVERIVAASERVRAAGLRFAYHNHDFEFGEIDLWSRLLATRLHLEPDVGWLEIAGLDPVTVLHDLSGRVALVHAKDVKRTNGAWTDVVAGEGELDWPAIARAAEGAGATHLVVELDTPSDDPVDDVARSLATLRTVV